LPLTFGVRHFQQLWFALSSHFPYLCLQRLDNGAKVHQRDSHVSDAVLMRAQLKQIEAAFNPLVNACVVTKTHKSLVNAIAMLVADMVLLLTMLIGLLRHTSRRSTGVWKLLYQQVSSNHSSHDSNAELLLVYNMDSLGGVFRDSTCGQSVSAILVVSSSTFSKVFLIFNLNGACFPARACEAELTALCSDRCLE